MYSNGYDETDYERYMGLDAPSTEDAARRDQEIDRAIDEMWLDECDYWADSAEMRRELVERDAYDELKRVMHNYRMGRLTKWEMAAAVHLWQRGQGYEPVALPGGCYE